MTALFKFVQRQYLQAFFDGNLYMNSLEYFAALECGDVVRADPAEGAHELRQFKSIAIKDSKSGDWAPIGGLHPGLILRQGGVTGVNVLCLYGMAENVGFPVDERNFTFGDDFVVLIKPDQFLSRVRDAAHAAGRGFDCRPVEYVRRDIHDGPMGPFRKLSPFAYQSEYRIAVDGGQDSGPLTLHIGDIRGLCQVGPLAEINRRIKIVGVGEVPSPT